MDWSYDTPAKHYVTIYRVMITQAGIEAGETTYSMLTQVLGLAGLDADGTRITLPVPPARDPFRRLAGHVRGRLSYPRRAAQPRGSGTLIEHVAAARADARRLLRRSTGRIRRVPRDDRG